MCTHTNTYTILSFTYIFSTSSTLFFLQHTHWVKPNKWDPMSWVNLLLCASYNIACKMLTFTDIPLKVAQNLFSLLLVLVEMICPVMEMFLSWLKRPLLPLTFLRRGGSSGSGDSGGGNSFSSFLLFALLDELCLCKQKV